MKNVFRHALFVLVLVLLIAPLPTLAQDTPYGGSLPGAGVNYETRLSEVEDQLRALTGKVEQMEYSVRRQDQTLQRLQSDIDNRLTKLESAPPPPTVVQAPQPTQPTARAPAAGANAAAGISETSAQNNEPANPETSVRGTLGELKMKDNKVTGGAVKPRTPPLPETPADYGLTAQEQYDRAFGLLRQASYEEAEKAFKSFIDKYPQDKMLDNAKYWYAETYYVRAKFNDAAVAFADAYQQNPKGTKAPDSLLKLALSLGSLEKTQDACTTLIELKSKYPNAPATIRSRADQARVQMKCGAKKP